MYHVLGVTGRLLYEVNSDVTSKRRNRKAPAGAIHAFAEQGLGDQLILKHKNKYEHFTSKVLEMSLSEARAAVKRDSSEE